MLYNRNLSLCCNIFNAIDRQKLEKELDKAWEKRNSELQKIDNEWGSIFSWFQRTFNYDQYKKRIEYRKLACEEEYQQKHAAATDHVTRAHATKKRLKQELNWFQKPENRTTFTRSGIVGKQNFDDIQRSREQCIKE